MNDGIDNNKKWNDLWSLSKCLLGLGANNYRSFV
jgi:hypothetical protein